MGRWGNLVKLEEHIINVSNFWMNKWVNTSIKKVVFCKYSYSNYALSVRLWLRMESTNQLGKTLNVLLLLKPLVSWVTSQSISDFNNNTLSLNDSARLISITPEVFKVLPTIFTYIRLLSFLYVLRSTPFGCNYFNFSRTVSLCFGT